MKPAGETMSWVLPPALLAEVEAAADEEHRAPGDVVREALERYLVERKGARPRPSFSNQEAHTRRGCGPDARTTQRHLFAGRRDDPFDD